MEPRAEFADYVDTRGRYVRQWRYGSGHRPLMESCEGPEGFDPPFGSGDVLVKVWNTEGDVAVYALSEAHWRRAALELAIGIIELEARDGAQAREDSPSGTSLSGL